MLTVIVYLASLAARNAFGKVNDNGQITIAQVPCRINIFRATTAVWEDRWYICMIHGSPSMINALSMIIEPIA